MYTVVKLHEHNVKCDVQLCRLDHPMGLFCVDQCLQVVWTELHLPSAGVLAPLHSHT